jgi:hypothetical protein
MGVISLILIKYSEKPTTLLMNLGGLTQKHEPPLQVVAPILWKKPPIGMLRLIGM